MVFNRKGSFFLNLDEKAAEQSVTVAPIAEKPKAKASVETKAAAQTKAAVSAKSSATSAPAETAPAARGSVQTTAEAIAAELAAEQAARPAKTDATFAPECVTAGGALPMRRRRGGANLASFRGMASGMFGKK